MNVKVTNTGWVGRREGGGIRGRGGEMNIPGEGGTERKLPKEEMALGLTVSDDTSFPSCSVISLLAMYCTAWPRCEGRVARLEVVPD